MAALDQLLGDRQGRQDMPRDRLRHKKESCHWSSPPEFLTIRLPAVTLEERWQPRVFDRD